MEPIVLETAHGLIRLAPTNDHGVDFAGLQFLQRDALFNIHDLWFHSESLEHGQRVRGEMGAVHVVDRVGELACDAEALGGAEARAVLDVALFVAVEPVHGGNAVPVLRRAGDDRGSAHRRHRGKRGNAVGHVAPVRHQRAERRGRARRHGLLEHRRGQGVDHAQHELRRRVARGAGHQRRMMRSPAYFAPARLRAPTRSQASGSGAR